MRKVKQMGAKLARWVGRHAGGLWTRFIRASEWSTSLRLMSFLMSLLLSLLLAGCSPTGPALSTATAVPATETARPAEPAEPAATPNAEQARAAILSSLSAQAELPHRSTSTVTVARSGATRRSVIELVPPDQLHITGDGNEMIVTGGKVFGLTQEGWVDTGIDPALLLDPGFLERLETTMRGERFVRFDELDGQAMAVYEYSSTTEAAGLELASQTQLWVSQADGLPYRLEIVGETVTTGPAGQPSKGEATTTIEIEYDPSIRIEAPQ